MSGQKNPSDDFDLGLDEDASLETGLYLDDLKPDDGDMLAGLTPDGEPADIKGGGNVEKECEEELDEVARGFRERAAQEAKRFELATDSEYWFCVCFQNRDEKESFLRALNLIAYGDKYLDGRIVAKKFGIDLPYTKMPYNVSSRPDRKLHAISKDTTGQIDS